MLIGNAVCRLTMGMVVFIVLTTRVLAGEPVAFATGDQPPYTSSTLPGQGSTTQLVRAICVAAGISPEFDFYPWKRVEVLLEQGQAFASFPYAKTAEREARFAFSEPLIRVHIVIVFNALNPDTPRALPYTRDEDLKPYRVGIIRGSLAEPRMKAAGVNYELIGTMQQAIAMLLASRIDFYIDDQASITHVVAEKFAKQANQIQPLAHSFDEGKAIYLMVSRTYPGATELLEKFNHGLADLKRSGEYVRLLARGGFAP